MYFISILISLCIVQIQATELKICINESLTKLDLKKNPTDPAAKEILFKNIYETLFYFDKAQNKISANLATKLKQISAGVYEVELKEKVQFHNNKVFFVKKYVDYKDVIFSLRKAKADKIKNVSYENKKLLIKSQLSLPELYIELSSPKYVIYSKAYYTYLEKKKKLNLFFERPIGTGPFLIEKLKAPLSLERFKAYHLQNRLNKLTYINTTNYLQNGCDVFWDYNSFKIKEYTVKNGYKVESSKPNNLVVLINHQKSTAVHKLFDPFKFHKKLFSNTTSRLTATVIPYSLKKSYILNPRKTQKPKEKKVKISLYIDPKLSKFVDISSMEQYIRQELSSKMIELNISTKNTKDQDVSIRFFNNIDSLNDLNDKVLCPYNSVACNNTENLKELNELLLKENLFIPLAYIKQNIFYKKNMVNIKFDFHDSIDYSEILFFNN